MLQFLLLRTSYLDHSRSQTAACCRERGEKEIGINQEHMIAAPLRSSVIPPVASLFESQSSDSFVQCTKLHQVMQVDRSCTLRPSTETTYKERNCVAILNPHQLHSTAPIIITKLAIRSGNTYFFFFKLSTTDAYSLISTSLFIEECAEVEYFRGATVYAYSRV